MREQHFIIQYESEWQHMADYLDYQRLSSRQQKKTPKPVIDSIDFPAKYRRLCNQLALAKTRNFSQHIIERLNHLVADGHHVLHKKRRVDWAQVYRFVLTDFPCAVRREKRVMLAALAAFAGPAIVLFMLIKFFPGLALDVLGEYTLLSMEDMYNPDNRDDRLGESRGADSDVMMFGVYVYNNIGIALRSFASGIVFGVLPIFVAVFNGIYLGAIFAHLSNQGYAYQTLYPFVITHGAFELTAIVIACGAGIRLGLSWLLPGRFRRAESLVMTARSLVPIIIGFSVMLLLAALIEAFWSAIVMPIGIKYFVGGLCWLLVLYYFFWQGRSREF